VGFGATIDRMEIVNQRRRIKDPATFAEWVKWAPGVHAIIGQEYFMPSKPTVSLDFSVRYTYLFSKDAKRFPSGFTGNDSWLTGAFGVNVHFWPGGKPIETAEEPVPEPAPETLAPVAPATPAPPDTTPAPVPAPAPPDTTVAPPDTTVAPPDTTKHAPLEHAQVSSGLERSSAETPAHDDAETFGAFGVTLPRTEDEGAACAIREKRTLR
jgi:hypothetical protein